ncbi:hypothetical protein Q7P37_006875 [Cladosporium fusiforme]
MQLLDLPTELLGLCCDQLVRCPDLLDEWEEIRQTSAQIRQTNLRALRLTCKDLSHLATTRLFSHVYLLPTKESARKARSILEDQRLNPLVCAISVKASLDPDIDNDDMPEPSWECEDEDDPEWDSDEDNEEHAIDTTGEVSATFKRLLDNIGLFSNLSCAEIIYDHQVTGPSRGYLLFAGRHVRESTEYRDTFLRKIMHALNHPDHPATKMHTLSIVNLQDLVNADIATSQDFKVVLSRLKTLDLCIASELYTAAPEHEIDIDERHGFYSRDLRKFWLQPLQEFGQLTKLKIYGSVPWGYRPKCDLRGLHFAKLTSLCLGHMTFTHDWQLDWILSHGDTLRSLTLDNCPIIPDARLSYKLDKEGYPIVGHLDRSSWAYSSRWHTYFQRLCTQLPRLRHFTIGYGAWNYSENEDRASSAFVAAENLPCKLRADRYCRFNGTSGIL